MRSFTHPITALSRSTCIHLSSFILRLNTVHHLRRMDRARGGRTVQRPGGSGCVESLLSPTSVRVPARPWLTVDSHSDCVRLAALLGSSGRRAIG